MQNISVTLVCLFSSFSFFLFFFEILIQGPSEQAEMMSGESCCSEGSLGPIVQYSVCKQEPPVHVRHFIALA